MTHTVLGPFHLGQYDHPKISLAAKETDLVEWKGDIIVLGVLEKDMTKDKNSKFENQVLEKFDSKLGRLLSELCEEEAFTGMARESTSNRVSGLGAKRVCLIGLGKCPTSLFSYRSLGESVSSAAKASQANNALVALASSDSLTPASMAATAFGIISAGVNGPSLKSVELFGFGDGPELEEKLKYAERVYSGVILGKEVVNAHSGVLTPDVLANEVVKIGATYNDVFTAVSINPPKLIHLCYKSPSESITTRLALVGNGSTFHSDGHKAHNIGHASMGGSAAVLGVAKALGQIKPPGVEVHFIVAASDNIISGNGTRHGGILKASNGKTIEVNNINAHGEVALAEALVYACKQRVDKIVDVATLIRACLKILGPSIAAVCTTSDELFKEVDAAANVTGERLCKLPMVDKYCEYLKSEVADTVITGVPHNGPITTALFLKQFVKEEIQWLHIDMFGPVWDDKKKTATGFAIPTLVEWVMSNSVSHSDEQVAATNLGAEMSAGQEPKRRKLRRRAWKEDAQKEN